jgi:hypothetical protein
MARVSLAHSVGKLGCTQEKKRSTLYQKSPRSGLWFSFSKSMARFTGFFGLH